MMAKNVIGLLKDITADIAEYTKTYYKVKAILKIFIELCR